MEDQWDGILQAAVAAYNKRQPAQHDWDVNLKPKIGSFAFKKHTTYSQNVNANYQYKLDFTGFQILERAATNTYKVRDIESGAVRYIPGDHLISTKLEEAEMLSLHGRFKISRVRWCPEQTADKKHESIDGISIEKK